MKPHFRNSFILHMAPLIILAIMSLLSGGSSRSGGGEEFEIIEKPSKAKASDISRLPSLREQQRKKLHLKDKCKDFFGGIGISYNFGDEGVEVTKVYKNYPADVVGIQEGDFISSNEPVKGKVGTEFQLTIKSRSGNTRTITMIRDKICTESTRGKYEEKH